MAEHPTRRGARYWLADMQACAAGDHGPWWIERFEQALLDHVEGRGDGTWQQWRDIRLTERPPVEEVIEVECDGMTASWSPTTGFAGDPAWAASAREAARGGYEVEWGRLPEPIPADGQTPLGALTALMYRQPGRTRITAWPEETRLWWEQNTGVCSD